MSDLNKIQRLCTDLENSEAELVMGQVYGLRQWYVLPDGKGGPGIQGHNSFIWHFGETNVATCATGKRELVYNYTLSSRAYPEVIFHVMSEKALQLFAAYPGMQSLTVKSVAAFNIGAEYTFYRNGSRSAQEVPWNITMQDPLASLPSFQQNRQVTLNFRGELPKESRSDHQITDPNCTCGFYAYTDADSLRKHSNRGNFMTFGLVKAYGYVTQGTKGFRAEKAEIVAITDAQWSAVGNPQRWEPYEEHFPIVKTLRSLVPPQIPVYRTLPELLQAAEPFLDPARKDDQ